jgi:predicted kinase
MKNLILVRGVSGSGKTTVASLFQGIAVSTDEYWIDDGGNYNFEVERLQDAHRWCQKRVEDLMQQSEQIVVHNTFTQEWELAPYLKLAHRYGYRVHTIIVENRHGGTNTHNVPDAVLEKQKNRFSIRL